MYILKQKPEDFIVKEIPSFSLDADGKYVILKLIKKDYNTLSALNIISKHFRCSQKDIGFSGNKDRQAITEQYLSLPQFMYDPKKLETFHHDHITLEYIGTSKQPLRLGFLKGNQFEIRLCDCEKSPSLQTFFVNYFGEQRFGTSNADIGKLLLLKQFKKAYELMIESGIQKERLQEYTSQHKNDYIGAISLLPLKLLSLFINAYQSKIWNQTVSQIIEQKDLSSSIIEISEMKLPSISKQNIDLGELPLIGFETEIEKSPYHIYIENTLQKEHITQRDFIISQIPRLSAGGGYRNIIEHVNDLSIKKESDSEYLLRFTLSKGSYATVFLKQLFI